MHPLADELNNIIRKHSLPVYEMLSDSGKRFHFPRGILAQSAEAKAKASRFNATIGIATRSAHAMFLPSVMQHFQDMSVDELFPYAPSTGKPELRAKWGDGLRVKNPGLASKSFGLPIVTSGVTHGLSLAADLFVDAGDVVLLPDPNWPNYNLIFAVRYQAQVETYPLFAPEGGFDIDGFRNALEVAAARGKIVVILNFPNNPTGYSITARQAEGIVSVLEGLAEVATLLSFATTPTSACSTKRAS